MFEEILGQSVAKEYLSKAVHEMQLPNTLLFTGPDGVGKRKTAYLLAEKLLGAIKSDLHVLIPEGKSAHHTIETIRNSIDISHQAPFEAKVKVFLIESAERMQPACANALLKTLEEPVLDSYWFLITSKPQEMLATVLSRCVKVPFFPLTIDQVATIVKSKEIAKFSEGSVSKALQLSSEVELMEAAKILGSLLDRTPPYHQLHAELEKIESLIESEDPLVFGQRVEHLFLRIALHLREKEGWIDSLDQMRLCFERNIRLSTCLEAFFLRDYTP